MAREATRIRVVHDDVLVAAGLATLLEALGEVDIADDDAPPHLVIADYEHALALLAARRGAGDTRSPRAAVLIVTRRDTGAEIRHAMQQGALGYLVLGCSVDELQSAVRALRAGVRFLGDTAARRLADSVAFEALTVREQAVLRLLGEGLGNKAIASRLDIAIGTVKSHLKAVFQKLDAASRTEAVAVADRRGLLAVPWSSSRVAR